MRWSGRSGCPRGVQGASGSLGRDFPYWESRLKEQPERDSDIIFRVCKASQSPVYPIRDASRGPCFLSVGTLLADRGGILPQLGAGRSGRQIQRLPETTVHLKINRVAHQPSHLLDLVLSRLSRVGQTQRKFPRLYARTNRDRRTRLATNRWQDSPPVQGVRRLLGCPTRRNALPLPGQPTCSDDEAHPREQLSMPFHLGHHSEHGSSSRPDTKSRRITGRFAEQRGDLPFVAGESYSVAGRYS